MELECGSRAGFTRACAEEGISSSAKSQRKRVHPRVRGGGDLALTATQLLENGFTRACAEDGHMASISRGLTPVHPRVRGGGSLGGPRKDPREGRFTRACAEEAILRD